MLLNFKTKTKTKQKSWLIEVLLTDPENFSLQLVGVITPTISLLNPVLPPSLRVTLLRAVTNIVAPLFYIGAAEKDNLKKVRLLCVLQNNVHPVME